MSADELAGLLSVQDLDLAVDQHRHRRDHLPERAELAKLDAGVAALHADLPPAAAARDEIAKREAEVEADLASTETRVQAVRRRLYSGEVSASRELQAMSDDVAHLEVRQSDLEDQVLTLLEERDPIDSRVAGLESQIDQLTERRREVVDRLSVAEAAVDGELATLADQRQEVAAGVPPALLATYEKLRTRLGGIGAARLVGSRCDGCHLTLSAVELDQIRRLPPGEAATCEQCSRILIPISPKGTSAG